MDYILPPTLTNVKLYNYFDNLYSIFDIQPLINLSYNSVKLIKMAQLLSRDEVIPLRHEILRKNQPIESCYYEEDSREGTFHLGIHDDAKKPICIASFYLEHHPQISSAFSIRLRGMATKESEQGKGLGSKVVMKSIEIIKDKALGQEAVLWCNARTSASTFYAKLGFEQIGDEFLIENIGPHYVMAIKIDKK